MKRIGILCLALVLALALVVPSVAYGDDPLYITGVTPVEGISVDFLTPYEEAMAELPETTTITVSVGDPIAVDLDWELTVPYFPYAYGNYEAVGTFELPDGVDQSDPPTELQVTTILRIESGRELMVLDWEGFNQPGDYVAGKIWFSGAEQTYYYYVPTSYDGTEPVPLVVELHGGWSNGLAQWSSSRFDRYAEKEGFITVAPNWGAGSPPYIHNFTLYISKIIDAMEANFNIDARRIYMCGPSGGGWLTGNFVLDYPGRIAAIGLVSGATSLQLRLLYYGESLSPMTVIMFAGTKESIGMPPMEGWNDLTVTNHQVADLLVQDFGCDPTPQITEWPCTLDLDELPYWTSEEDAILISETWPTSVTSYIWTGGIYGSEVIVYDIEGGGHVWPGGTQYVVLSTVGAQTYVIDATEELWKHFSQHQLPTMETAIEIRPGSDSNPISLRSKGVIPVAILTTEDLDATQVYSATVRFGPDGARPEYHALEDVNGDGMLDMILHFRTQETGIQEGDTSATLTGWSYTDGAFFGSDAIITVPR